MGELFAGMTDVVVSYPRFRGCCVVYRKAAVSHNTLMTSYFGLLWLVHAYR